jgi:hypothetical protein
MCAAPLKLFLRRSVRRAVSRSFPLGADFFTDRAWASRVAHDIRLSVT